LSHPAFCGLDRAHLGVLIEELADPWLARCESGLRERRGRERKRAAGAGPDHKLVFTDRVLVTLVHLRLQLPHAALAELYGVTRPTVTRAIHQIRPLLAARGFAVPDRPGLRLRTLADVFAYAQAEGVEVRIDGTETQVRRPKAGRPGRKAFVSAKKKQNTAKTTTLSDGSGRLLWSGADRPGRMHDQTAMRTKASPSSCGCIRRSRRRSTRDTAAWPTTSPARSMHRRTSRRTKRHWARSTPGARRADGSPPRGSAWRTAVGEEKKWRPLQRYLGCRESYAQTHAAIAALVSDRAARRPTRRRTSTALVLAHQTAC
jgi:hypothetical protein